MPPNARPADRVDGGARDGTAGAWLTGSLVYLAAAVVAVPIARVLGLGSVLGYLVAGVVIGPWGLKLVTRPEEILHFAEFGVVLMLFLVGLELEPQRLWALRKPIFGWGACRCSARPCCSPLGALALGVDWRLALVAGARPGDVVDRDRPGVAAERNLLATTLGRDASSASRCCRTSP